MTRRMQFASLVFGAGLAGAHGLGVLFASGNVSTEGKEDKMAAVRKVATLLEELQAGVLQEGEEEAATYNKFACFCKDTATDKGAAVTSGQDSINTLDAKIGQLVTDRETLDTDIGTLESDVEGLQSDIKDLKSNRTTTLEEYERNAADLTAALTALEGAIQSLKASKNPSLAQVEEIAKSVSLATDMADALGLRTKASSKSFLLLQQAAAPDVPIEEYKFHSDDIVSTLEGLLGDFKTKKQDVDKAEVQSVADFDSTLQEKENSIKTKEGQIATKKKTRSEKVEAIATSSRDLSIVSAELMDDKAYLQEASTICANKAKTWDARTQVRSDELSALTQAISLVKGAISNKTSAKTLRFAQRDVRLRRADAIVTDSSGLENLVADADRADAAEATIRKLAFLQRRSDTHKHHKVLAAALAKPTADGRQAVIDLLRNEGVQLKSSMLVGLASQLSNDPFAKVKTLLQELIERLLKQASNEATQKGWCDKSISAAEQKRNFAAEQVRSLNGGMAQREARKDKLVEELTVLDDEMDKLEQKQNESDSERAEEKIENNKTITEAKEGETAVQGAVDLLNHFYKAAAKGNSSLNSSLVQVGRGPFSDDMPDSGFGEDEAYLGDQGGSEGVIGLLEVISSDFARTAYETERAEAQATQDHIDFTTKTQSSLAEKGVAKTQKTQEKDDVEGKLSDDETDLGTQTALIEGAVSELIQLKETCDKKTSYEDRVARRDEEIAALKKADCILNAYAQYGPDAAVSADC